MGYRADGSGQSGPRGGVNRSRQSRFRGFRQGFLGFTLETEAPFGESPSKSDSQGVIHGVVTQIVTHARGEM